MTSVPVVVNAFCTAVILARISLDATRLAQTYIAKRAVPGLDPETERSLADFGNVAVSRDGRTILYGQMEETGSNLMLVENFR